MTLLLNDKLAVLYRGGRSRRREFIFKCRRLRGKKGDDSVGKCSKNIRILEPEEMRQHFVWAGVLLIRGGRGAKPRTLRISSACGWQHQQLTTVQHSSPWHVAVGCWRLCVCACCVCVLFYHMQLKSSFVSILRGLADIQVQLYDILLRTWALLLFHSHLPFSSPL